MDDKPMRDIGIIAVQIPMLCFYKDNELVAVMAKNGKISWFKTQEMIYTDYLDLFEANKVQQGV